MKKYLKELEIAGIILLFIGVILGHTVGMTTGACAVAIGLLLWVATVVIKAFNWNEFRRDNIVNIFVMLGAIILIFISLILAKL
jgi:hypothetical protein